MENLREVDYKSNVYLRSPKPSIQWPKVFVIHFHYIGLCESDA